MTVKIINGYLGSAYYLKAPVTTLIVRPGGHVAGDADYGIVSPVGGSSYSVANQGVVDGGEFAVYLRDGGTVTNGPGGHPSALIAGAVGVAIYGAAGTVSNLGTVEATGTSGAAVSLEKGGRLVNGSAIDTSALLDGYQSGVRAATGDLILNNFGTIIGGAPTLPASGVVLVEGEGSIVNGARQDSTAVISGVFGIDLFNAVAPVTNFGLIQGIGGVAAFAGNLSVRNLGTIEGAPGTVVRGDATFFGFGVAADYGGVVVNGANADQSALIEGSNGVIFDAEAQASSKLANLGTIDGESEDGVNAYGPLILKNGSTPDGPALIEGAEDGVSVTNAAGTAINWGAIVGNGASSSNAGLYLGRGGLAVNNSTGVIRGANGVLISAAPGTVKNTGSIRGTSGDGVDLVDGGSIVNGSADDTSSVISGAFGVYVGTTISNAPGTVTNFGTINGGSAGRAWGIVIAGAGKVGNGSATDQTATIYGYTAGVAAYSGAVRNLGTIRSGGTTIGHGGVLVGEDGLITNGSNADRSALIVSPEGVVAPESGVIRNFATIDASYIGALAVSDGLVVNGSNSDEVALIESGTIGVGIFENGAVVNFGTIEGGQGDLYGGVILNQGAERLTNGSATDRLALATGGVGVDVASDDGVVRNFASIEGAKGTGVELDEGGRVINIGYGASGAGAVIEGVTDGVESYLVGTIDNLGKIIGDVGVYLRRGGLVTNGARTAGGFIQGADGVESEGAAGTVRNFGLILARGAGAYAAVELLGGGEVVNGSRADSGALLIGAARGVLVSGVAGAVTNFGTIQATAAGGYAVQLAAAGSTLAVEAGSEVIGKVSGGGGTLDLASGAGTLSGIAGGDVTIVGSGATQAYDDFGTLAIGAGAVFTLGGSGTIATGGVASLDLSGVLDVTGSLTVSGAVSGSGVLEVSGVADLATAGALDVTLRAGGELKLGDSQAYAGVVRGLSRQGANSLDLEDIAFGAGTTATYSGTASGGVLTVTDGTHTARIGLDGNYLSSAFTLAGDGAGGTLVTDPPARAPALASALAGFAPSAAPGSGAVQAAAAPGATPLAQPSG